MQEITLKDIDELIENSNKYNSVEKYLKELTNLIFSFLKIDIESTNYQALLNRELEQSKKRFIAFCLLRVYSANPDLLRSLTVKHSIHKFLLQSIPDIFKQLKITQKTETYEIESKLTSYIKEKEKNTSIKINIDIDLHFIQKYRNLYRSEIKQKKNNPVLWQFFGSQIDGQLFDKIFDILIEYNDSGIVDKYAIFNKANDILDNIIGISNEISTKYSLEYISKPFSLIQKKLNENFKENPYSKPAELKVLKTQKKYPFSKNIKYKIQLLVENSSTGYANDATVNITLYSDDIIKLQQTEQFIGHVKVSSIVEFEYTGLSNSEDILLYGYIEWTNFDRKKCKTDFELNLSGQKLDIDWPSIENEEPYDLEPVTDENEFIGRKKIITELKKIRKKVGSSYVFGQRRVGKTSIVKTLQSIIKSDNILVLYIEAGDWDSATSPHKSMEDLGKKICTKIKRHDKKFSSLLIPDFEGSFNRLTDFLDEVSEIDDTFRVIIILDEFDRISNELLYTGNIAKSFMLTIRAISNREQFGFILVGGEKLEYILSQWQEFNKFKPIRVDYFNKETEWEDFKNLIKYPIRDFFEITDKAIDYIYNQTSGNPYFTKKICVELFSLMVSNRDNHITEDEAKKATNIARDSDKIAATDFSHFWKDGIKEREEKEEEISINRRKVLLSIGQILKTNRKTTKQAIIDKSIANGLNNLQAEKTLDEFIQRKILKIESNKYSFVVQFFEDWLISNGLDKIITTFQEEQRIILRERYEEQITIKSDEINLLSKSWQSYKGKEISTDIIREWLEQFESIEDQRCIFKLLENTKLYTNNEVREKMEDLFRLVKNEIKSADKARLIEKGRLKRDDILVSYLDQNPVKSGAEYAKIFVEANNIYKDNSTNPDKLEKKLVEFSNINALVFIDDFIGTGNSIIENIEPIILNHKERIEEKNIIVIIGVITGFQEAKHKVEVFAKKNNMRIKLFLLDPLDESNKCFNVNSLIYTEPIKREKAKDICNKIGLRLEKKHPLGFGNCQATVVFPNTCPNNTLPILWKETNNWKPLFKR